MQQQEMQQLLLMVKRLLNNIFDIIEKAGWHTEPNGYAANVIRPVKSVLNMHDNDPRVVNAIIGIFEPIKPNTFFADALRNIMAEDQRNTSQCIWKKKLLRN